MLWQLPQTRLFDCNGYKQIWVYLLLLPLFFIAITRVPFRLPAIQFLISEPNTLISIVILLGKNSSMGQLLCPLSFLSCKLLTSSPSLKLLSAFVFLLENSQCFLLPHREFEGEC